MKKKIISIFVVISSLLFLFLIFFATFKQVQKVVSGSTEYYLDSLDTKYPEVIEYLQTKNLDASYDEEYSALVIEDLEIETNFYFEKRGISEIDPQNKEVYIKINEIHKSGEIKNITLAMFGGIDTIQANYDIENLSKPHAVLWGDNLKYADSTVKAEISNEEIKELVEKAEYYEKLIKDYFDESSTVVD